MTVEQLSTSKISSTCPTGVNYISKYAGDLREKSHEVWTWNSNRSRCMAKKMTGGAIKAPPPPPMGLGLRMNSNNNVNHRGQFHESCKWITECPTFAPVTVALVINANVISNPNPSPNPNLNPYPTSNQKPNHYPHSNYLVPEISWQEQLSSEQMSDQLLHLTRVTYRGGCYGHGQESSGEVEHTTRSVKGDLQN